MSDERRHIRIPPHGIQRTVYIWYRDTGEWPKPIDIHMRLAEEFECPVEVASYDTLLALNEDAICGIPTTVARRLGQAHGDWRDPLPNDDNGFRLCLADRHQSAPLLLGPMSLEGFYTMHRRSA